MACEPFEKYFFHDFRCEILPITKLQAKKVKTLPPKRISELRIPNSKLYSQTNARMIWFISVSVNEMRSVPELFPTIERKLLWKMKKDREESQTKRKWNQSLIRIYWDFIWTFLHIFCTRMVARQVNSFTLPFSFCYFCPQRLHRLELA